MISKFILRISSNIKSDFIVFFIIANLLILASNIPLILRFIHTPPGMIFNFSHTPWDHDYNLYRSAIVQGKYGDWLFHDPFTSDPTTPGIFYIFYTLSGKLAFLLNVSSSFTYHLIRIMSLEIFVILSYILTNILLGKDGGLMAAYIALTGGLAPLWFFKEKLEISLAIPWWTNFDPLERLNTLPHYIIAQNFLLICIILFIYFLRNHKIKYSFYSAVSIFIGGISFPAILAPIGVVLTISLIFLIIRDNIIHHKKSVNKHILYGLSLIIISAILSLIIIKTQEHQGFPWNIWTSWNVTRWNYSEPTFNYNFIFIFGVLPLIAIPSIINNLRTKNIEMVFVSIWFLLPYILLPFVNILQIPKLRLVEDAHFIPLAILASQTIFMVKSKLNSKIITYGIFIVYILLTIPAIITLFLWRLSFISHNFPPGVYYASKKDLSGLDFIKKAVPKNSIFLTSTAHILPAYAPVISFWGHMDMTNNFAVKGEYMRSFFGNQMFEKDAQKFLLNNHIDYVYEGPDSIKLSIKPLTYKFLYPIYKDESVTISKFVKKM